LDHHDRLMIVDILCVILCGIGVFYGLRTMRIILMIESDEPFPQSYERQQKYGRDDKSRGILLCKYALIAGLALALDLYVVLKFRSDMLY
jgi:hypothetical protein